MSLPRITMTGEKLMRRLVFGFLGALLVFPLSMMSVLAAQDATPESAFADLGLPTLDVTVTADGYEGIPESLEAGRYLVTVTAAEDVEFGGGVAFIQPEGMSADEFLSLLAGPPDETGVGAVPGTPILDVEATPAEDGGEMGGPPPAVFESTYAGGSFAMAGQSAQVVLDLPPGEWIAWGDDPGAPQEPVIFEVTGEMPADLVEPESGVTVIMGEYMIEVSEGQLTAGQQVVRVDNIGAQPHFIFWAKVPDDVTEEQIEVVLEEEAQAERTGTPPVYSDFNPEEDAVPVAFTATQSTGTTQWVSVDLEPGTYVLICFFPDIADGVPHAYKGMYTLVEVAE
jgi:hypothetical protein